jgi:SP family general alpha glucoside:H+ symporter-like MFS transporter
MTELNIEKSATTHLEETLGQGAIVDAKHASDEEHAQTLFQAISANHRAVIRSMLISRSIVMEGYDVVLIGDLFGDPQFAQRYGTDYGSNTGWQISAPWQSGLTRVQSGLCLVRWPLRMTRHL